jgi:peptidoglycan-N-acetylglucosamine deacetylase
MATMDTRQAQRLTGSPGRFVFHDASGRRWARLRHGLQIGGLVLGLGAFLFVLQLPDGEQLWAWIGGVPLVVKGQATRLLEALLVVAIVLTLLRAIAYGGLAVGQKVQARRIVFETAFQPPVSVIVPAHNEEKVIVQAVASVLRDGYPDLEVLVVSDGSTDRTVEVLQEAFGADPRVRVHAQARGGKAAALNTALALAQHGILIAIDADTALARGTIGKLVRHFSDPEVGAVSGNVRVGNRGRWITRFQSIEYVYGFNLDRRALALLNAMTVVPGATSAWRRDLIENLGGFSDETLAEDADLTLAVRRLGYLIRYDEEAVAYTEAPDDAWGLARQRFRWAFGTLQVAWKHRDALCRPRYGSLGFVALPSIWLTQFGLGLVAPFADLAVLTALMTNADVVIVAFYLGFFALELAIGLLAYSLEGQKPTDLALLLPQRLFYRIFMHGVLSMVILVALKGQPVAWGKLERRGQVPPMGPRIGRDVLNQGARPEVGPTRPSDGQEAQQ